MGNSVYFISNLINIMKAKDKDGNVILQSSTTNRWSQGKLHKSKCQLKTLPQNKVKRCVVLERQNS